MDTNANQAASTDIDNGVYDVLCGICFTVVNANTNPRGKINSCDHQFCAFCIREWSTHTNICPLCKARFTRISVNRAGTAEEVIKVRRRNFRNWEASSSSSDDEGENDSEASRLVCAVCGGSENPIRMILCDNRDCSYIAHLECLKMSERPLTFLCRNCECSQAPQPQSVINNNNTNDAKPPPPSPPKKIAIKMPEWLKVHGPSSASASDAALEPSGVMEKQDEDPLYFLKPSPHTRQAQSELADWKKDHPGASPTLLSFRPRGCYGDSKQCGSGETYSRTYTPPSYMKALAAARAIPAPKRMKRERGTEEVPEVEPFRPAPLSREERIEKAIDEEVELLTNPSRRSEVVERLAREWAVDTVDVIRSQRFIQRNRLHLNADGGIDMNAPDALHTDNEEAIIWREAVEMCRPMVEEKLRAHLHRLHQVKERTLRIRAQREAAALAKLATIIGNRRNAVNPTGFDQS